MDLIKKERELVWLQVLYLFLIPILLLYFKVVPGSWRVTILLSITFVIYLIARHEKWSNEDFGIQKSWAKYFNKYFYFTIAGIFLLFFIKSLSPHPPFLNWWTNAHFLLLFIPLSVLQEILFRGTLMHMLRRTFTNPVFIILLNACLFSLMHIIYLRASFTLPITFVAGIGFAWIYYKYPNLILISISHIILNFLGMIFGFFILR